MVGELLAFDEVFHSPPAGDVLLRAAELLVRDARLGGLEKKCKFQSRGLQNI